MRVRGTVKKYLSERRFGFFEYQFELDGVTHTVDVLFSGEALERTGQAEAKRGQDFEFDLYLTDKGLRARDLALPGTVNEFHRSLLNHLAQSGKEAETVQQN